MKKIKKWNQFNEEAGLTLNDLDKPSPIGKRGDVLVKKLKDGDKIDIEGGSPVTIDDDIVDELTDKKGKYSHDNAEDALKDGRLYKPAFKEKGGKFQQFKLNQLSKTADFGSTKGASAGTKITREQESVQTFLLAYTSHTGVFPEFDEIQHLIDEEISNPQYIDYYKVDHLPSNIDELSVYYNTWKWTTEEFITELSNPQDFEYHQIGSNSDFIQTLKDVYTKCSSKTLGKTINISKWNPADIWVINRGSYQKLIRFLNKCESLPDLTQKVDDLFEKGILLGLSLKKISDKSTKKIIINGMASRPVYELKQKDGIDFNVNNKSLNLFVDKFMEHDNIKKYIGTEKMTLSNNSSGFANINVEITSISSRQGKCNLRTINQFLEEEGVKQIPTYSYLKDLSDDQQDEFIELVTKKLDNRFRKNVLEKTKDLKESDLISRMQSLLLCERLYNNIEIGNRILNKFMLYALAIEWSVGDNTYACPMYYRVIEY